MIGRNTVSFLTNNTSGEKPDHSPALGKRFKFITFAMFGFRVILPVIAQQHSLLGGEANSNQPGAYDEYCADFCSVPAPRSETRRVRKDGVSTCRCRGSPEHSKKKKTL